VDVKDATVFCEEEASCLEDPEQITAQTTEPSIRPGQPVRERFGRKAIPRGLHKKVEIITGVKEHGSRFSQQSYHLDVVK